MQGMFDDVTVTAIRTFYDESQLTANYTISQRGPYCAASFVLITSCLYKIVPTGKINLLRPCQTSLTGLFTVKVKLIFIYRG